MKLKEITSYLESFAPLELQEDYDNAGLIIGNEQMEITGALLTVDVLEEVVDEAIQNNLNLIISHHPINRSGVKKITGKNYTERIILKAIKNDISIYVAHTNFDSSNYGMNVILADLIGINNRNLGTLKIDLQITEKILNKNEIKDKIIVSESGIKTKFDLIFLKKCGAQAFLIGSSIMMAKNIEKKVTEFVFAH